MARKKKTKSVHISKREQKRLIKRYIPLVKHIVGKMAVLVPSSTITFDEFVDAGVFGLIDAASRYDPNQEVKFETFAGYRIRGAILDEVRAMDWCSRSIRRKIKEVENAVLAVEHRTGKPAEGDEIAQEMELTIEDYQKMIGKIWGVSLLLLDDCVTNKENSSAMRKQRRTVSVTSNDNPEENIFIGELKQRLAEAIRDLSEKEQLVISLYYYDDLTLEEIGYVMELTESRVWQIHALALIKLKRRISQEYLKECEKNSWRTKIDSRGQNVCFSNI